MDVLERLAPSGSSGKEKPLSSSVSDSDFELELGEIPQKTMDEEILDLLDVIPVSASNIIECLNSMYIDVSIPQLMTLLMDLTYKGLIVQEGVYFRKKV